MVGDNDDINRSEDTGNNVPEGFLTEIKNARIIETEIVEEMQTSYIDYAMMVIVGRALPDVRDGLKPVHRRILFGMEKLGLTAGSKFVKSARIVGDVIGKYHPHGDTAVYDAMVRLVQDFSLRYPLVRGQGNFGSIDGDNAAAMRYTEAKMMKITEEMLMDLEKNTVDFRDNYDGSFQEPSVLPARVPMLLLNGSMGIAVGMATNIPPHNITEIIDASRAIIKNPELDITGLCEIIKGPDFPTGASIYDAEVIKEVYRTGRGSIIMRGSAEVDEVPKTGRGRIIITEIPYQVNKADLIVKIANLVKEERIVGISDIRDESSKGDIRVVIELKKDAYPRKVLNLIFKLTPMQSSFGVNMVALVDGGKQPKLLNLKEILIEFLAHRKEVVIRRTKYELAQAEARAHILQGLKIALDHIDEVIKIIRAAETKELARDRLIAQFTLSQIQAEAILLMRLQTLAGLERNKIEQELVEKMKLIVKLKAILADEVKIWQIIDVELAEIGQKYGDKRRTKVFANALGKFSALDTIPDEQVIISITNQGYIKRTLSSEYRRQNRGGKGMKSMTTKTEDAIRLILHTKNHNDLLYFTNLGRVFRLPVYEINQTGRAAKGQAIVNFLNLQPEEKVMTILDFSEGVASGGKTLIFATTKGQIKKTSIDKYQNIRVNGLIAMGLKEGDELLAVEMTGGESEVMLVTREGKSIRFAEDDVRSMGRSAAGVRGIRLRADDRVVQMGVVDVDDQAELYIITANGMGKRTVLCDYRLQSRGGSGVKVAEITKRTGLIVGSFILPPKTIGDLLIVSRSGKMIRSALSSIPKRGRSTQGVYLMRMGTDQVASTSVIIEFESVEREKQENKQEVLI